MVVVIVIEDELTYSRAPSSRALYLTRELLKEDIPTILVGQESTDKDIVDLKEHIISMKRSIHGRVGKMLLRFQIVIEVLQLARKKKIEYIVIRGYWLGMILSPLIKLLSKGIIYDFHGYAWKEQVLEGRKARSKFTKFFEYSSLKIAGYILVISEGALNQLQKKYQKKTIILPNGVDLEIFKKSLNSKRKVELLEKFKIPIEKKIVGFVGFWGKLTDIECLINSSKYIGDNLQIVIIGEGYNYDYLKDRYKGNKRITFTGKISHENTILLLTLMFICVAPYIKKFDNSQDGEEFYGSPRKNREYLAAGKPIVISNIRGESFLVEKKNKLTYKAENSKDLARKIKILLNNEKLYKEISQNNLKLAYEFTWEKMVKASGIIEIMGET